MKEQYILSELKKCGVENDKDYTVNLKKLIFSCTESDIRIKFYRIIDNKNIEEIIRFGAYYALFTYYRRFEMRSELFELCEKYGSEFDNYKLNNVVQSQYYKFKFIVKKSIRINAEDIRVSIDFGQKAINELGSINIGVYNNYAELVLAGLDRQEDYAKQFIDKALRYVEIAIDIQENKRKQKPYSRYYCSIARLLAYKFEYERALNYIEKAIGCEGTEDKDALIRIGQYNNFQLEIKMKELMERSNQQMELTNKRSIKIMKQIDSTEKRYIELLAFFSSVIALIITSVNVAINVEGYYQVAGLLMILAAILIIAFVVLKLLINFFEDSKEVLRIFFSLVLAVALLGIGLYVGTKI